MVGTAEEDDDARDRARRAAGTAGSLSVMPPVKAVSAYLDFDMPTIGLGCDRRLPQRPQ
jgi:hypothetical protein